MKQVRLLYSLNIKLLPEQRRILEETADQKGISLGEAAREFLDAGFSAMGVRGLA